MKPFLMGTVMAVMMLWMGHDQIMSGNVDVTGATLMFVLAHVAALSVVLAAAFLVPRLCEIVTKHRPSVRHAGLMVAGMVTTAGSVHVLMHGVLL